MNCSVEFEQEKLIPKDGTASTVLDRATAIPQDIPARAGTLEREDSSEGVLPKAAMFSNEAEFSVKAEKVPEGVSLPQELLMLNAM